MFAGRQPTSDELKRESSIQFAIYADGFFLLLIVITCFFSGSMTVLAEVVRISLMLSTEVFALLAMRRIHRGLLTELEFGSGKLEQLANLSIATGMLLGAVWIIYGAGMRPWTDQIHSTPAGLAVAAAFMAGNTYVNFVAWISLRSASTSGSSLLMEAQLRSRLVKLNSSIVVSIFLTLSAIFTDPTVAMWCDVLGALFVSGFMITTARGMIRDGLPDLLDKSVDEVVQRGINRALARHFDDYDRLERVRSRRSGKKIFVEVSLGFDAHLSLAEVDRRIHTLKASIDREIDDADISILASSLHHESSSAADSAKA